LIPKILYIISKIGGNIVKNLSNAKEFILIACFSVAVFAQNEQPQNTHLEQYQYQQQQQQQQQQVQYQYSQQPQQNAEPKAAVQQLIKAGLMKNKDEIQKASIYLTPADKTALYEKNKKKAAGGWAALDFAVGFGVGSYIQGDVAFGIAQSLIDAGGYTLMVVGMANLTEEVYDCDSYSGCGYEYHLNEEALQIYLTGIVVWSASRIMSWIFPFVYQKRYNRTLNNALNGSNSVSYSIDPLIVPRDGAPAVGLAFNMHY
jgi:hypothetical protein